MADGRRRLYLIGRGDGLRGEVFQLEVQSTEIVAGNVDGCHELTALNLPGSYLYNSRGRCDFPTGFVPPITGQ